MSPHQTRSGASALKSRSTKSGAAGRLPGRVSPRRLRTFRATRPNSAMSFAMVFPETRHPRRPAPSAHCGLRWVVPRPPPALPHQPDPDLRRAVGAVGRVELCLHRFGQMLSAQLTPGGPAGAVFVEPRLTHAQGAAGDAVRNAVLGPEVAD